MKIVYYHDPDLKFCPVKQYLSQFNTGSVKDIALLADIDSKIIFLSNQDSHPHPPISKSLHGYAFFEIGRRKPIKRLIRVLYFCNNGMLVLLNAFDKPDDYSSQKIKKNIN